MHLFETWNSEEALSHLISLVVAYLLALPIGWNREREERSAGLRTFPLVSMAACGFVMIAIEVLSVGSEQHSRFPSCRNSSGFRSCGRCSRSSRAGPVPCT